MRLVDAEFEAKHYLSMLDKPTPDVTENDKRTALAIARAFQMARTVEPERTTGHWEDMSWRNYIGHRCSVCGESCSTYVLGKPRDRFCKWRGAKMEGVEE